MISSIIPVAIQSIVILLMFVVGLELTSRQLRELRSHIGTLTLVALLQIMLLALTCLFIYWIVQPERQLMLGIILIAASPGGALSNYYTLLAKGDIAFSVSLTTLTTLLSFISIPLFISGLLAIIGSPESQISVPIIPLIYQLFLLLIIPVLVGMLFRHLFCSWYIVHQKHLQIISFSALLLLILLITWEHTDYLLEKIETLVTLSLLFNGLMVLSGLLTIGLLRLWLPINRQKIIALLIELPVRNLGIAALLGTSILGNSEMVVFCTAFLILQTPLIIFTIFYYRSHKLQP